MIVSKEILCADEIKLNCVVFLLVHSRSDVLHVCERIGQFGVQSVCN
jgi:hypothetical protein